MSENKPIITLTTDFGTKDYYVGAMKAVMLAINAESRFIDISHDIPPQDIMAGAWVIRNTAFNFPPGTVHLTVVDPGVGTDRKPVALKIGHQFFVGPDNGIFSLLTENHQYNATDLSNRDYWNQANSSNTFHGRDIFAPVAAHIANGVPLKKLGKPVDELVSYRWAIPIADKDGVQGWILHIDRFGNLVTNISNELIKETRDAQSIKIYVGNTILRGIQKAFADVQEGEPLAYIGSSGMLEIAINKGSAEEMLGVHKGASVSVIIQK